MAIKVNENRGMTLIELLVSISLFVFVIGLSSLAFALFTDASRRELSEFEQSLSMYRVRDTFTHSLSTITPYAVKSERSIGYYFLGREEGFTALVINPMFDTDMPAVVRVFKEHSDSAGLFRLVYEEASLRETQLTDADQQLTFSNRVVIQDNLKLLNFEYFGWPDKRLKNDPIDNILMIQNRKWMRETDGLKVGLHPQKVKIQLDDMVLVFDVFERPDFIESRMFKDL